MKNTEPEEEDGTKAAEADTGSVTAEEVGGFEDAIDKFYGSIKSRMMVGEVITNIENNAHFTFDFLMLLILASVIAFIGLGIFQIIFTSQFKVFFPSRVKQRDPCGQHADLSPHGPHPRRDIRGRGRGLQAQEPRGGQ